MFANMVDCLDLDSKCVNRPEQRLSSITGGLKVQQHVQASGLYLSAGPAYPLEFLAIYGTADEFAHLYIKYKERRPESFGLGCNRNMIMFLALNYKRHDILSILVSDQVSIGEDTKSICTTSSFTPVLQAVHSRDPSVIELISEFETSHVFNQALRYAIKNHLSLDIINMILLKAKPGLHIEYETLVCLMFSLDLYLLYDKFTDMGVDFTISSPNTGRCLLHSVVATCKVLPNSVWMLARQFPYMLTCCDNSGTSALDTVEKRFGAEMREQFIIESAFANNS